VCALETPAPPTASAVFLRGAIDLKALLAPATLAETGGGDGDAASAGAAPSDAAAESAAAHAGARAGGAALPPRDTKIAVQARFRRRAPVSFVLSFVRSALAVRRAAGGVPSFATT